jgi:hypothetical protein
VRLPRRAGKSIRDLTRPNRLAAALTGISGTRLGWALADGLVA